MKLFIPEALFVVASATAMNYFLRLDEKYGLWQVRGRPMNRMLRMSEIDTYIFAALRSTIRL